MFAHAGAWDLTKNFQLDNPGYDPNLIKLSCKVLILC